MDIFQPLMGMKQMWKKATSGLNGFFGNHMKQQGVGSEIGLLLESREGERGDDMKLDGTMHTHVL